MSDIQTITVISHEVKKDGSKSYVTYNVKGKFITSTTRELPLILCPPQSLPGLEHGLYSEDITTSVHCMRS
jgi:hypothetical protein